MEHLFCAHIIRFGPFHLVYSKTPNPVNWKVIKMSHLIIHCYDRQEGYLSVGYQVQNQEGTISGLNYKSGLAGMESYFSAVSRNPVLGLSY